MQKKLPYILAIVLPFLVVWPLSVILLPQAATRMHWCVLVIALILLLAFALHKSAWWILSAAMIASVLLFWVIDANTQTLVPDLHFQLFQQQYETEAERICATLSEDSGLSFDEPLDEQTKSLLAEDGAVYQKEDTLIFNTQMSLFSFYGYAYLPESTPRDQVEQSGYDFIHWINDQWAWVKVY